MELKFLTPTEVWDGFKASEASLENSIISVETANNLVCSKQYFTAEAKAQGSIRAYAEIYYDNRWADPRAAILLLSTVERKNNDVIISRLIKEGYVVGVVDYCGGMLDAEEKTTFPANLEFASYPACKTRLDTIQKSARLTPWFVWSKIARRAICLLEQLPVVDNTHIGVIGMGEGAEVAWQVAGMDARVRALVAIGGTGYRWAKDKPRFLVGNVPASDEERAYSTGVGAETYAKFIHCPTMLIVSRSAFNADVDRAGDILSLVQTDQKQLLITGASDTQFTTSSFEALLQWLRTNFVLSGAEIMAPSAVFENVDGKLYLRMNTVHKAEKIEVFVCYGEPMSTARHWIALDNPQKVDVHVYTVGVPVFDTEELIIAYATFTYENGMAMSTPVQGTIPQKLNVKDISPIRTSYRIMYDSSMGLGSFACLTTDAVLEEDCIRQESGPFDILGITAKKGGLYLCRSSAELKALDRTSALHFDAYSPTARELCVELYTYPNAKRYTAYAQLDGGEFWQKILLQSADFKSDEGKTLPQFSDTKILTITDAVGVLLNNFLWI